MSNNMTTPFRISDSQIFYFPRLDASSITVLDGKYSHFSLEEAHYASASIEKIFTRVFTTTLQESEKFLSMLNQMYTSAIGKHIIDVIAFKMYLQDDALFVYGAEVEEGLLGYFFVNSQIDGYDYTDKSQWHIPLSLRYFSELYINSSLADRDMYTTISHEMTHFATQYIFANYSNPYQFSNTNEESSYKSAYTKVVQDIASLVFHSTYKKSSAQGEAIIDEFYERFDEILSNQNGSNSSNSSDKNSPQTATIMELAREFLISKSYSEENYPSEIIARLFSLVPQFEGYDSTIVQKLLGNFSNFLESVYKPGLLNFVNLYGNTALSNGCSQDFINEMANFYPDIKTYNLDEQLFFAVVDNDYEKCLELMEQGARPDHDVFGIRVAIQTAILRDEKNIVLAMLEKFDDLDLFYKNPINGKSTIDIAKEMSLQDYKTILVSYLDEASELHQSYQICNFGLPEIVLQS